MDHHGWSQDAEYWSKDAEELLLKNGPEERKRTVVTAVVENELIIEYEKFLSYYKLLRVGTYILRFIHNVKHIKEECKVGIISTEEIREAKSRIIKLVQAEAFIDNIKTLKFNNKVRKASKLIALLPYLDDEDILRIGGRLKHAILPEETKHPIILPSHHHFTKLIILHHHEKLFHVGVQTTLNCIREEFWPILARSRVKGILHKCVKCNKASPKTSWQLMRQLSSAIFFYVEVKIF